MKKIIQAAALILIAAFAILAAASSYPGPAGRKHLRYGTELAGDTDSPYKCRHTTDNFIYEQNH